MDKKAAEALRLPFLRQAVITTWVLLATGSPREAFVIVNEGPATVLIGNTGTSTDLWMAVPSGNSFTDNYTKEPWYCYAPAGSGTVSGFIAIE